MTFSGPVQVPGATLDAGTYRFRLANPDTRRNVLQVLSNDGATVHAMFNTIQDHRTDVAFSSGTGEGRASPMRRRRRSGPPHVAA